MFQYFSDTCQSWRHITHKLRRRVQQIRHNGSIFLTKVRKSSNLLNKSKIHCNMRIQYKAC